MEQYINILKANKMLYLADNLCGIARGNLKYFNGLAIELIFQCNT